MATSAGSQTIGEGKDDIKSRSLNISVQGGVLPPEVEDNLPEVEDKNETKHKRGIVNCERKTVLGRRRLKSDGLVQKKLSEFLIKFPNLKKATGKAEQRQQGGQGEEQSELLRVFQTRKRQSSGGGGTPKKHKPT